MVLHPTSHSTTSHRKWSCIWVRTLPLRTENGPASDFALDHLAPKMVLRLGSHSTTFRRPPTSCRLPPKFFFGHHGLQRGESTFGVGRFGGEREGLHEEFRRSQWFGKFRGISVNFGEFREIWETGLSVSSPRQKGSKKDKGNSHGFCQVTQCLIPQADGEFPEFPGEFPQAEDFPQNSPK